MPAATEPPGAGVCLQAVQPGTSSADVAAAIVGVSEDQSTRLVTSSGKAASGFHEAIVCICGNVFMDDSVFCRKCGVKRSEVDKDACCLIKLFYYVVAFFALWFGPGLFDYDCDGDFDVQDVDKFIQDAFRLRLPRKVKTRRRSERIKKQSLGERVSRHREFSSATATGGNLNRQAYLSQLLAEPAPRAALHSQEVEELVERLQQQADRGAQDEVHELLRGMLLENERAEIAAAALADKRLDGIFTLDRNADGKIDILDLLDSRVQGESQENQLKRRLLSGQTLPLFVLVHCLAVFALWLAAEVQSVENFGISMAGLETFLPGKTTLRLYRDSGNACEDLRYQAWRWLSYQYTHVGMLHITMNCILTIVLGVPLEGLNGTFRMALMFHVGVLGGACCCFLSALRTPVVGMSGGCYALFGIHLADLLMNWTEKRFRIPTFVFLVGLAAMDLLSYHFGMTPESASHSAHLGGYIAGVCIGVLIGNNPKLKTCECVVRVVMFILGVGLLTFCFVYGLASWPPRDIWDQVPWCWARQVWNPDMPEFNGSSRWHCVRCGDQACIDKWSQQHFIETVNVYSCSTTFGWTITEPEVSSVE